MKLKSKIFALIKPIRVTVLANIFSNLLNTLSIVGLAYILSWCISQVHLQHASPDQLIPLFLSFLGFIGLRLISFWLMAETSSRISFSVKSNLRKQLIHHLSMIGMKDYQKENLSQIRTTIAEGIDAINDYFTFYIPQIFISIIAPVSIMCIVFPLDWLSGLVLLLTAPLIPFFMILLGSKANQMSQKRWNALHRMSAYFLEVLLGLTTLKLFNKGKSTLHTIESLSEDFRKNTMDVLKIAFLSALVLELIATISTAVIAVEIGIRLLYDTIAFQFALFILILAPEYYQPLRNLGTRFHAGLTGTTSLQRIFEFLVIPAEAKNTFAVEESPASYFPIRFQDVSYSYDESSPKIIDSLSFTIQRSQWVSIIGPNGSGKSTLIYLLLGFLKPTSGTIYFNDVPMENVDLDRFRNSLAWLPQKPYIINDTIETNVIMGNIDSKHQAPERLQHACQLACIHDFIQTLPLQYQTTVGEKGGNLSGGESQRVALARVFYRQSPFIILDEYSNNIDVHQDTIISDNLRTIIQRQTCLSITHNLQWAKQSDWIIILGKGKLLEQGSPQELLEKKGLFYQMGNNNYIHET